MGDFVQKYGKCFRLKGFYQECVLGKKSQEKLLNEPTKYFASTPVA